MTTLTSAQLEAIRKIIADASSAVAVTTVGHDATPTEIQRLVDAGFIDPETAEDLILDSFTYGQILQQIPEAQNMTYAEFHRYLQKNPVKLSRQERATYDAAKNRAGVFVTGIGDRFRDSLGGVLGELDGQLATKLRDVISDATARKTVVRESISQLSSKMKNLTEDWSRDWDRVAITESHLAHQEGFMESSVERYGEEGMMAKMPEPSACPACLKAYLGPDGKPIVKPMSWWLSQGVTNVGKKAADYKPTYGGIHPRCRCQAITVPDGWKFNSAWDLVPESMVDEEESEKSLENDVPISAQEEAAPKPHRKRRRKKNEGQLSLFGKGENVFGGYAGAVDPTPNAGVGTMGNRDSPARTAGQNTHKQRTTADDQWPPGIKKKKRKKRNLVRPNDRYDLVGTKAEKRALPEANEHYRETTALERQESEIAGVPSDREQSKKNKDALVDQMKQKGVERFALVSDSSLYRHRLSSN